MGTAHFPARGMAKCNRFHAQLVLVTCAPYEFTKLMVYVKNTFHFLGIQ